MDPIPDNRTLSFCRPYHSSQHPVLLGVQTGEREFGCRARTPSTVVWSLEFAGTAIEGYTFAAGVPKVGLSREDLPFSPIPYEATLLIEARGEGESTTREWSLVVLPDPDALRLEVEE